MNKCTGDTWRCNLTVIMSYSNQSIKQSINHFSAKNYQHAEQHIDLKNVEKKSIQSLTYGHVYSPRRSDLYPEGRSTRLRNKHRSNNIYVCLLKRN